MKMDFIKEKIKENKRLMIKRKIRKCKNHQNNNSQINKTGDNDSIQYITNVLLVDNSSMMNLQRKDLMLNSNEIKIRKTIREVKRKKLNLYQKKRNKIDHVNYIYMDSYKSILL